MSEKRATRIIKKTGHVILKEKSLTKTIIFMINNICITENSKEKHMLSIIFHLRTNDVKVPLEMHRKKNIIPKTDNTKLHKIWLKLCNFVKNDLIKNV
jgi:hypothetical protein